MSTPIVTSDDLGTYLDDPTIKADRADMMIGLAQTACEAFLSPLPPEAAFIVLRIAKRGYTSATAARSAQLAAGGSPFGGADQGASGVYVTTKDEYDLIRLGESLSTSGTAAFTIRMRTAGPSRTADADGGWIQSGWSNEWGNYGGPSGFGPW